MKVHLHEDARGLLHSIKGLPFAPREVLVSRNKQGTLKGLHMSPYRKIVYVSSGCIHDFYAVQAEDETEPRVVVVERVLREGEWLEVPAHGAHGFFCPQDSLVIYLLEDEFDAAKDRTIFWKSPEYRFEHTFLAEYAGGLIISPMDAAAPYATDYDYLVLGAHGYLGKEVVKALRGAGRKVLAAEQSLRLSQQEAIRDVITRSRAKYVVCAAGISGKPTIQWSEDHELETFETNMLDTCNLIRLCRDADVHLTYLGSALVYASASATKVDSIAVTEEGVGATLPRGEEEEPDLVAKVYCRYRVMLEQIIRRVYKDDVLYLRLIYPCTFDGHPKCFFQKMLGRTSHVNNVGVSLTVVPDLFPLLPRLIEEQRATGILNFVNPGAVKLPALLEAAGAEYTVAPTSSASLASEVLCTAKLCDLLGEKAVSPLSESIPRYVATHKRAIAER
jgi:3,5-epimerase/4-reductase